MNGLSIKHINGDQIRFEMTATKVIHRHRVTPLIHYENFDEIWVESLNAVMPMAGGSNSNIPNHASSRRNCKEGSDPRKGGECLVGAAHTVRSAAKDMTQNQHDAPASIRFPLRDLAEEFKAINHSWVTEVTRGDGASHGHDVLSRVVVDRVAFTFTGVPRLPITLRADRAKIGTGFSAVLFEENVVIQGQRCLISAPLVLGSGHYKELLFPLGFRKNGKHYKKTGYLTLLEDGTCRESSSKPRIVYHDVIEEQEAGFISAIKKDMPLWASFLLAPGLSTLVKPK